MEQVWSVCLLASVLTPLEHWRYAYKLRYGVISNHGVNTKNRVSEPKCLSKTNLQTIHNNSSSELVEVSKPFICC